MPKRNNYKKSEIKKLVLEIAEKYADNNYTIESVCNSFGVSVRTFYTWLDKYADIAEIYKKAKAHKKEFYPELLRQTALISLKKQIEGYTLEDEVLEITESDGVGNNKRKKVYKKIIKRKVQPSLGAVIFALTNIDKANWKRHDQPENDQNIAVTLTQKTEAELLQERQKLLEHEDEMPPE